MKKRTRPTGAARRPSQPSPPSTRPPRLQSSVRPPSTTPRPERASHEVYVQIANLQMARSRQKRIRRALQGQVDRCTREIESINARIRGLYDQAGLERVEPDDRPAPSEQTDDGFEYQY